MLRDGARHDRVRALALRRRERVSATLVVLLILAIFIGLYFYVANDLAELIARDRFLDEIWSDESVGASVGPQSSSLEQLTAGPAARAGGPYDWKSEGFVA
jgi:hypothetical protein